MPIDNYAQRIALCVVPRERPVGKWLSMPNYAHRTSLCVIGRPVPTGQDVLATNLVDEYGTAAESVFRHAHIRRQPGRPVSGTTSAILNVPLLNGHYANDGNVHPYSYCTQR